MIKVFKKLNKGIQRSIIVGDILLFFGIGALFNISDRNRITDDYLLYVLLLAIPLVLVLTFLGLWIYSGFKNEK